MAAPWSQLSQGVFNPEELITLQVLLSVAPPPAAQNAQLDNRHTLCESHA
jgi:hypothetical protein